jgi:hypothetical protein
MISFVKDTIKDLQRDNLLTAKDLDEIERELSAKADKLWDEGCWAKDEMNDLVAQIKQVREDLQAVYAARVELYSNN